MITDKEESIQKCYISPDISNKKIIHFIITRFLIEFYKINDFDKIIYKNEYILNGFRVMKKYLIPSLENQRCKKFIWILTIGEKNNISYIESLLNFNSSFEVKILYYNNTKSFIRDISKKFDILITTRIDYDDRIYYDAINDVRKAINIKKPILLYGYNRGLYYYETDNKYYDYYYNFKGNGASSIFLSLITVLKSVNDIYTIYDLGVHNNVKKKLLESLKIFGIKELNYEPAIFDSGEPKFVMVRQIYSGLYNYTKNIQKKLSPFNFDLNKFYGKE